MEPILGALLVLCPTFAFIGVKWGIEYYSNVIKSNKLADIKAQMELERYEINKNRELEKLELEKKIELKKLEIEKQMELEEAEMKLRLEFERAEIQKNKESTLHNVDIQIEHLEMKKIEMTGKIDIEETTEIEKKKFGIELYKINQEIKEMELIKNKIEEQFKQITCPNCGYSFHSHAETIDFENKDFNDSTKKEDIIKNDNNNEFIDIQQINANACNNTQNDDYEENNDDGGDIDSGGD